MRNYRPILESTIPLSLLQPTYTNELGVAKKTYPAIDKGEIFYGSFKTYGGTEQVQNGVYSIVDTANIATWYNPDIKSDCRVGVLQTGAVYEIINQPENVNMRNQYMKFKVKRIKGQA